jgi:hypothetical protein
MKANNVFFIAAFLFYALLTQKASCGGAKEEKYSYSPESKVESFDSRQIDDDAIAKIFKIKPQLIKPLRLGWYNMSYQRENVSDLFIEAPEVAMNFEIGHSLIFGDSNNLKTIRFAAARAHCDIIVITYGQFNVSERANWTAWSALFVVFPLAFIPYMTVSTEYQLEAYAFDVRNEFMYTTAIYKSDKLIRNYVHPRNVEETIDSFYLQHRKRAVDHVKETLSNVFQKN